MEEDKGGCSREETEALVQRLLCAVDSHAADPWAPVLAAPDAFLHTVFALAASVPSSSDRAHWATSTAAVCLLERVYACLDCAPLRRAALRLVSAPLWTAGRVPPRAVAAAVRTQPRLARMVAAAERRYGPATGTVPERDALHTLVCSFLTVLEESSGDEEEMMEEGGTELRERYCAAVLSLLCTLLCQLPTRRFVHTYLRGMQLLPRLRLAPLTAPLMGKTSGTTTTRLGRVLGRLVARYAHYDGFPVDDATGAALDAGAMAQQQSRAVQALQAAAHRHHPAALHALVLASARQLADPVQLTALLRPLADASCRALAVELGLLPPAPRPGARDDSPLARSRAFLVAVLAEPCRAPLSSCSASSSLTDIPLFPTESDLWDPDLCAIDNDDDEDDEEKVGEENDAKDAAMGLPRLTLQYLALRDYLERHFRLLALDAAGDARDDVEAAVKRVQAAFPADTDGTGTSSSTGPVFEGVCEHALPVGDVRVVRVMPPRVGEAAPAGAVLELGVALDACADPAWRVAWDALRPHDVLYLVALRAGPGVCATAAECDPAHFDRVERGVSAVRGCEVVDIRDDDGTAICGGDDDEDSNDVSNKKTPRGNHRRIRVLLDGAQYVRDTQGGRDASQIYAAFNLVVRRSPEQSDTRATLQTLRDLVRTPPALPDWLVDPLLGYVGGASSSSTSEDRMEDSAPPAAVVDMGDTFLSREHLAACHPGIKVTGESDESAGPLNYRIALDARGEACGAEAYRPRPDADAARRNRVPFTGAQARALEEGMREGLALVAGAPGTGKCTVAAQLVACLCHAHSAERIVLVARTPCTLDRVLTCLAALDIDERHFMRLGGDACQKEGSSNSNVPDLSPRGRVDHALARRLVALTLVGVLARATGVTPAEAELASSSCELAGIFHNARLLPLWERFKDSCTRVRNDSNRDTFIAEHFPFKDFVAYVREWQKNESKSESESRRKNPQWRWLRTVPQKDFVGEYEADVELAEAWCKAVGAVFDELAALRVLELVRTPKERAAHVLRCEARVVALTGAHAAQRRTALAALGLRCDTLVVLDAAQLLEAEALAPLVLARHAPRRVVLVGDPSEAPPAPFARALRTRSTLDRSLLARLLALGAPHTRLNAQGVCRPAIAETFAWACPGGFTNLPCVIPDGEGNNSSKIGLAQVCQLVDVGDHQGHGETRPVARWHQNLGEAEAVVHTYMYMRLHGCARDAVALLTPHRGQQALLRDVVARRCCATPALAARYGAPAAVATVAQYQGQRADYVLLSLVRTAALGALADPRVLIQALSRARQGLYVFCRAALFAAHPALAPFFRPLARHGTHLLCPDPARPNEVTPVQSLVQLAQIVHSLDEKVQKQEEEHHGQQQQQQGQQQQQ